MFGLTKREQHMKQDLEAVKALMPFAIVAVQSSTTAILPDCRTCEHYLHYDRECGLQYMPEHRRCKDADQYQPLPPVRLYRSER